MYTYMSVITLLPRNVSKLHRQGKFFSMEQQSILMYVEWHPDVSLQIFFIFFISLCELKLMFKTWISWKVVAGCTSSLQSKQHAIICL